jgi:hypothetical protein
MMTLSAVRGNPKKKGRNIEVRFAKFSSPEAYSTMTSANGGGIIKQQPQPFACQLPTTCTLETSQTSLQTSAYL